MSPSHDTPSSHSLFGFMTWNDLQLLRLRRRLPGRTSARAADTHTQKRERIDSFNRFAAQNLAARRVVNIRTPDNSAAVEWRNAPCELNLFTNTPLTLCKKRFSKFLNH
jgi:hypothetical protein